MPNKGQWPTHQKVLYNRIELSNTTLWKTLTPIQKEYYYDLWQTESEIYSELVMSTDYPDALAEVVAKSKILNLVNKK